MPRAFFDLRMTGCSQRDAGADRLILENETFHSPALGHSKDRSRSLIQSAQNAAWFGMTTEARSHSIFTDGSAS